MIPQYTYLDVKAELQGRRDQLANADRLGEFVDDQPNRFHRLESDLIRRLREYDWATRLLAGYQNLRISQHIIKEMVHILMIESALEHLEYVQAADPHASDAILLQYQGRLRKLHDRIANYQRDFGELYQRFETRFAKKAALVSVLRDVERELRKGAISTKVYVVLEHAINRALDEIPEVSEPIPDLPKQELIGLVPLFNGLPEEVLSRLADKSSSVNFLPDDVIIGQGEHGDAMYVLAKGRVRVTVEEKGSLRVLNDLCVGDCFGEMAMLGDSVRRATVTALHACTLLRLTAGEVSEISSGFPEVRDYLNELSESRKRELNTTGE